MARFYENDRNTPPRPPRPMPPGDVARRPQPQRPMSPPMPSGPRGGVSNEESERRIRDARNLMPMPRRSEPRPMPPGLEGQQYLAPGGMGGRMSGELNALVSFLNTPGRVARGAIEGGARAVNPDFEMPDYSNAQIPGIDFIRDMMRGGNAQIPGVDFMNFITGSGVRDQGRPMPRISDTQQEAEARLRAYMRQMRGGG